MSKPLPKFQSIKEEAVFWDTHSPDDFGEWKEIELEVAKPLKHTVVVDRKVFRRISEEAKQRGLGVVALVNSLLKKGLETENLKR